jgi:hypothetical protein
VSSSECLMQAARSALPIGPQQNTPAENPSIFLRFYLPHVCPGLPWRTKSPMDFHRRGARNGANVGVCVSSAHRSGYRRGPSSPAERQCPSSAGRNGLSSHPDRSRQGRVCPPWGASSFRSRAQRRENPTFDKLCSLQTGGRRSKNQADGLIAA